MGYTFSCILALFRRSVFSKNSQNQPIRIVLAIIEITFYPIRFWCGFALHHKTKSQCPVNQWFTGFFVLVGYSMGYTFVIDLIT